MAYRLRRMEMQKENASKADFATLERAYNMLADPYILAQYDNVLRDATTPVAFPYSGFGSLIVRGERSADSGVFFANQILAFLPERRHRTVPVPLRKLDYFEDYAILRDHNRKIEVLIDHQLLPLRWDPTWSRWRHLIFGDGRNLRGLRSHRPLSQARWRVAAHRIRDRASQLCASV